MDVSGRSSGFGGGDVDDLLASLGSGGGRGSRPGVWFEVGEEDETEDLLSFRRYSDNEIEFKEYDDLGMVVESGLIIFGEEKGKIGFDIRQLDSEEKLVDSWFALVLENEKVVVYSPWKLLGDEESGERMKRVLKGYAYLKQAELVFGDLKVENTGVGISGEEEGRLEMEVVKSGKLG